MSLLSESAYAQTYGQPAPHQIALQPVVTKVGEETHVFYNNLLVPIIIGITIFVLLLLLWVMFRFNARRNPVPSKVTHNTLLEMVWTIVPVLILGIIAIPSFRLLTHQVVVPEADIVLKVVGKQWYWAYEYPKDQGGGFAFDSFVKPDKDLAPDEPRLLAVDNEVVVPINKVVKLQVTAADVIHSFAIQAFAVRIDAVPGRLNEAWFKAEREGIYYGQCSKLCGKDHAYMPIAIRVVSEEAYKAWLAEAKKKFASLPDNGPVRVSLLGTSY